MKDDIPRDTRLVAAADRLRDPMLCNVDPGFVNAVAELLDRLALLAPYWAQPYAAPFVPVIEAGVGVAAAVNTWLGPAVLPPPSAAAAAGDEHFVSIDPARQSGRPCLNLTRITTETVAGCVLAGDNVDFVAEQYAPHLTRADVLLACWYQARYGAKLWRGPWAGWAQTVHADMWHGRWDAVTDPPTREEPSGHEGGRYTIDESHRTLAAEAEAEAASSSGGVVRPWEELITTGLLWLINASVLHPRGYALGLVIGPDGIKGWRLLGDGSKPWRFDDDTTGQFAAAQFTLQASNTPPTIIVQP